MSRLSKTVVAYALRCEYALIRQRLLKSADKYETRYGELSKVSVDYLDSNCPKKMKEVLQVLEVGKEFGTTIHEEPDIIAGNLFGGYILPSAAAITVVSLIGEIAYRKHLKDKCQDKYIILFHSGGHK
ncbi:hypothetical protein MKX03_021457 [Papaver bracteatum]|nr:hypothetical protein MKX03_021457 [Papaver bracteatum]